MDFLGLNNNQIIYTGLVIGLFAVVYGWKFYKNHKKKQEVKWKRKQWKSRY